ncbi:MAG: AMP-binding protein, partial [Caldilinea sp.]
MSKPQTLPQYFIERTASYGADKIALRQKELGIWQEFTWQESYAQVRDIALGLIALGLQRGDRVATVGDNDRFYLWAYLG